MRITASLNPGFFQEFFMWGIPGFSLNLGLFLDYESYGKSIYGGMERGGGGGNADVFLIPWNRWD